MNRTWVDKEHLNFKGQRLRIMLVHGSNCSPECIKIIQRSIARKRDFEDNTVLRSCIVKLYQFKDYLALSTVLKNNNSNEKFLL